MRGAPPAYGEAAGGWPTCQVRTSTRREQVSRPTILLPAMPVKAISFEENREFQQQHTAHVEAARKPAPRGIRVHAGMCPTRRAADVATRARAR